GSGNAEPCCALAASDGHQPRPVQGGQNASDDICSCDLGPGARSHFRRFAGNTDRPASGGSCERCRCRERHAGACVRLALPSITSLASLVLPASSALKSMYERRTKKGTKFVLDA